ncbi:MAG: hypothetical protein KGJ06_03375 [Pseudomonadota bacterium]|nr:hypothetical protein [Pseudomonadota bacterium]
MSSSSKFTAVLLLAALLTACGDRPGERALSGGAIGAGVGAAGGALIGGDPLTGAVVGGGVGAVTGAVTNKRQIDLDR